MMKRILLSLLITISATACSLPIDNLDISEDGTTLDTTVVDGRGGELEVIEAVCGDGLCDPDKENCIECLEDCGECACGDGACTQGEDCESCPDDCGICEEDCGDEICNGNENCDTCPADCGNCCENDECDFEENCDTCPADCGDCCGNEICDYEETCETCPADCTCTECGNETCEEGEDCSSCPDDCDECVCDDGTCEGDETCVTCPEDCGECQTECGNDDCEDGEDCMSCADDCGECVCGDGTCNGDESCDNCPEDCTDCDPYCGDGIVTTEIGEECDDENTVPDDGCDEQCKIEPQEATPGTIIITEIMKNPEAVDDLMGEWFELYNTTDDDIDLNGWTLTDDGVDSHKILSLDKVIVPGKGYLVMGRNGDVALNGGVTVDYVYKDTNLSNKDDEIILSVYGVTIDAVKYDYNGDFPTGLSASLTLSAAAFSEVDNDDGALWCEATTAYGEGDFGTPGDANDDCQAEEICGNEVCGETENCENCEEDCGQCCGNDECDFEENCDTCPADCGECCGNNECDFEENCDTCPADCGECCGNNECDFGETCETCVADCGECCGNNQCEPELGENCETCVADCGDCCGDSTCKQGENCDTCPADCGSCCPNGQCDFGETCGTCPLDCGACCGNNLCDNGETCVTCATDCGPCCGNNQCDNGETCETCEQDCGSCDPECGDNNCDPGETCVNCTQDCGACCGDNQCANGETCETCEQDCGPCQPEVWCALSGSNGQELTCKINIAAENAGSPKATQFQFDFNFNSAKVQFDGASCMDGNTDVCDKYGVIVLGHTVGTTEQSAGVYRLTLTNSNQPKAISNAYKMGQSVQGDPYVLDLKFSLKQSISAGQPVQVTLTDFVGAEALAGSLTAVMEGDLIVTSSNGVAPECGDNNCDPGESCSNCAQDCGACPPEVWCALSGNNGQQLACEVNIAAESISSPKATQFQFDFNFNSAKVKFDGARCMDGNTDVCEKYGVIVAGHSVGTTEQSAGIYRLTLTNSNQPKAISNAYKTGQTVQGDPYVLDLKFSLKQSISAAQPVQVSLTDFIGAEALAGALSATQQVDGLIVTKEQ